MLRSLSVNFLYSQIFFYFIQTHPKWDVKNKSSFFHDDFVCWQKIKSLLSPCDNSAQSTWNKSNCHCIYLSMRECRLRHCIIHRWFAHSNFNNHYSYRNYANCSLDSLDLYQSAAVWFRLIKYVILIIWYYAIFRRKNILLNAIAYKNSQYHNQLKSVYLFSIQSIPIKSPSNSFNWLSFFFYIASYNCLTNNYARDCSLNISDCFEVIAYSASPI